MQNDRVTLARQPTSYRCADAGRGSGYESDWLLFIRSLNQGLFSILRPVGLGLVKEADDSLVIWRQPTQLPDQFEVANRPRFQSSDRPLRSRSPYRYSFSMPPDRGPMPRGLRLLALGIGLAGDQDRRRRQGSAPGRPPATDLQPMLAAAPGRPRDLEYAMSVAYADLRPGVATAMTFSHGPVYSWKTAAMMTDDRT